MEDRSNPGDNPASSWRALADWDTPASPSSASLPSSPAPVPTPPPLQPWGTDGNGKRRSVRSLGKIAVAVGLVLALAAGGFVYLSLGRSSGSTALAFSLSPGNTLRYTLHMNMAGTLTVQRRALPFNMEMSETFSWKVESVDAQGVATVDMTVE